MINSAITKISLIISVLFLSCSPSQRSKANAENIQKLRIGMRMESAIDIMGSPESIKIVPPDYAHYIIEYTSPPGYAENFCVFARRQDSVIVGINYGKKNDL